MTVQNTVAALLLREVEAFERELELFPDEAAIWQTLPGVTNSAGNLALHIAGNLQHFIGAVLGGSGYVRDRDREFSARSGSRADLIQELRKGAAAVETVIPRLTDEALHSTYPSSVIPGRTIQTERFLLHLCAHASFHLGQLGYLRRALTGQNQSAGPVSLHAMTEPA
jgi:hypothetical protein